MGCQFVELFWLGFFLNSKFDTKNNKKQTLHQKDGKMPTSHICKACNGFIGCFRAINRAKNGWLIWTQKWVWFILKFDIFDLLQFLINFNKIKKEIKKIKNYSVLFCWEPCQILILEEYWVTLEDLLTHSYTHYLSTR